MPTAAVEISNLTMRYGARTVVDELSLTAPAGALTVVLGPNGAGKTTTIETAEGFRAAQSGSVRVLGREPRTDAAWLSPRVGVMLQSGGVWPPLPARAMLAHVARLYQHPLPVDALLERLGLDAVGGTPYRRLSGGEQQKLALACAVIGRPELVFLDEPTTGLDPASRLSTWAFLRELREAGASIVMSTHLLDEAQALADHVVVIAGGQVVASGSVRELTSTGPTLRFDAAANLPLDALGTQLGPAFQAFESTPGQYRVEGPIDAGTVAAVTAWCAQQGTMPSHLSTEGPSLSDAYFALTAPAQEQQ